MLPYQNNHVKQDPTHQSNVLLLAVPDSQEETPISELMPESF